MSFDDDDDDPLMQTVTGARDDDESGLRSPLNGSHEGQMRICPDPEEFPPGCRVTLPDSEEEFRELQLLENWEPDPMADLIGATGTVLRHTGDYSLVQFFLEDVKVSTTIFRGALNLVLPEDDEEEAALQHAGSLLSAGNRVQRLNSGDGRTSSDDSAGPLGLSNSIAGGALVNQKSMTESIGGNLSGSGMSSSPHSNPEQAALARTEYDEGTKSFANKDFKAAVEHFSASLVALVGGDDLSSSAQSIPTAVGAHYILSNRSVANLALGDHNAAFEDAQLAISIKPTSTKGYVRAGNVHRTLRQYTQAKKMFAAALKYDPTNPEIQYLLKSSIVGEMYVKNFNLSQIHVSWTREAKFLVRSRKIADSHHQLFAELPLFGVAAQGSEASSCDYCCRTLIESHVFEAAENISADLRQLLEGRLQNHYPSVPCVNGCGALYCSERCRDKAMLSFHAVECKKASPSTAWCEVFQMCGCDRKSCELADLTDVEASLLHLALRIVATTVTRIRAERPHNFDAVFLDLLPSLPLAELSSAVGKAVAVMYQCLVTKGNLTTNEKQLINENNWIQIVGVVMASAKFVQCSPWEEIRTSLWTRGAGCVTEELDLTKALSPQVAGITAVSGGVAGQQSPSALNHRFSMSTEGIALTLPPPSAAAKAVITSHTEDNLNNTTASLDLNDLVHQSEEEREVMESMKKQLEEQLNQLASNTVEGMSCSNQACVIFPTLPHFKKHPQGNVKVYHQGCWKPTLVGVSTRPLRPADEITIQETSNTFRGECARQCGRAGTGFLVSSPGLGSVAPPRTRERLGSSMSNSSNNVQAYSGGRKIGGLETEGGKLSVGGGVGHGATTSPLIKDEPNTPFTLEHVPTGME